MLDNLVEQLVDVCLFNFLLHLFRYDVMVILGFYTYKFTTYKDALLQRLYCLQAIFLGFQIIFESLIHVHFFYFGFYLFVGIIKMLDHFLLLNKVSLNYLRLFNEFQANSSIQSLHKVILLDDFFTLFNLCDFNKLHHFLLIQLKNFDLEVPLLHLKVHFGNFIVRHSQQILETQGKQTRRTQGLLP